MRIDWDKVGKTVRQRACDLPESIRKNFKRQHSASNLFVMDIHDVGGHLADLVVKDANTDAEVIDVLRKTSEERTDG